MGGAEGVMKMGIFGCNEVRQGKDKLAGDERRWKDAGWQERR